VVGIAFQKPGTLPDQKARKASGASYGVHERSGPVHWAVEPLFSVSNRGGRTFRRGYCRHDSGVALSGDGTVVHITRSLPSSSACRLLRLVLPIMRSFMPVCTPLARRVSVTLGMIGFILAYGFLGISWLRLRRWSDLNQLQQSTAEQIKRLRAKWGDPPRHD
jgi:hypothetical protein